MVPAPIAMESLRYPRTSQVCETLYSYYRELTALQLEIIRSYSRLLSQIKPAHIPSKSKVPFLSI